MAKRVDNDSTMEVSSSQLVSGKEKRPAPHQAPGVSKNDVSMWIGNVVGADDFTGLGKKKPPKRRGPLIVIAVLGVAAVAGGVGYFVLGSKTSPPVSAGSAAVPMVAFDAPAAPADAAIALDAPADAPLDAASPPDAAVDAGVPTVPAATVKKPAAKKTTKKTVTKKKPAIKKKPATHKK